jgi:hypothetical protein
MKEHVTFFRLRELGLKYSPEGKRKRMDSVRLATKLWLGMVALRISK